GADGTGGTGGEPAAGRAAPGGPAALEAGVTRDVPIPRAAAADWADLTRPAAATPARVAGELPAAAGRWLAHATPAGSPPRSVAELRMEGEIRLGGRWHPFTARQVIAPGRGFVWAARAR